MKVTIKLDEVVKGNLAGTTLYYKRGLHNDALDSEDFVEVPAGQDSVVVDLDNSSFYTLTPVSTYSGEEGQPPGTIATASIRIRTSELTAKNRAARVMEWSGNVAFMGAVELEDIDELRAQLIDIGAVPIGSTHNIEVMPLQFYIDGKHYMTHVTHTSSYDASTPSRALQNADKMGVRYTVAGVKYRCDWQEAPQKAAQAMYDIYMKSYYNQLIHQKLGFNIGGTTNSSSIEVYLASVPTRTSSSSDIPSMQTLFVSE